MTQLPLRKAAALAFAAMFVQDILLTSMVIFEAHYDAVLAGAFDVAEWLFGLVCAALAIGSIIDGGWKTKRSKVLIAAVSCANFLGTCVGVFIVSAVRQ